MAYKDFSIKDLKAKFGILEVGTELFKPEKIVQGKPSELLKNKIADARYITLSSKKAVSAQLIAPVVVELVKTNEYIQVFADEYIVGDEALGLMGEFDFIFSRRPWMRTPEMPLFCITEAKLGAINKSVDKAAAQMLGIKHYNHKVGLTKEIIIHGVVTDGTSWRFLKLDGVNLFVDVHVYSVDNLPFLLGAFQEVLNFYKK